MYISRIVPLYLTCWLYWHALFRIFPYYLLNACRGCSNVSSFILDTDNCVFSFFLTSLTRSLSIYWSFQSFQFQWFSFIVFMFSISLIFAFLLFLSSAYHGFNLQFDYDVTLIIIWFSLVYSLKICWSVSLCIAIFYGVWDSNLCLTEHLFPTLSKSPELDLDFSL